MSKLKTKGGVKKRFRFTASGRIKCGQAGKRHNMRKRSNSMLRKARGTTIMKKCDANIVKKYAPYNR
ncbi:MAG: 50S ribosomal protein L35 [Alphaproteobacteria bacterium]|nr:MAG: 50S ribosomal protein L35 [Alphaproteobacteria bacterium]